MPHQRGGRRSGTPGKAYSNRTDLNENRTLPVQTPQSTGYGDRVALERQQQAVPLRAPDQPSAGQAGPAAAPPMAPPPGLNDPTGRPDESLTAGLGAPPPSPAMERMADYLPSLAASAELPTATAEYRNLIRRLRAATP